MKTDVQSMRPLASLKTLPSAAPTKRFTSPSMKRCILCWIPTTDCASQWCPTVGGTWLCLGCLRALSRAQRSTTLDQAMCLKGATRIGLWISKGSTIRHAVWNAWRSIPTRGISFSRLMTEGRLTTTEVDRTSMAAWSFTTTGSIHSQEATMFGSIGDSTPSINSYNAMCIWWGNSRNSNATLHSKWLGILSRAPTCTITS